MFSCFYCSHGPVSSPPESESSWAESDSASASSELQPRMGYPPTQGPYSSLHSPHHDLSYVLYHLILKFTNYYLFLSFSFSFFFPHCVSPAEIQAPGERERLYFVHCCIPSYFNKCFQRASPSPARGWISGVPTGTKPSPGLDILELGTEITGG